MNIDGSSPENLTMNTALEHSWVIAPNGRYIVYWKEGFLMLLIVDTKSNNDLYKISINLFSPKPSFHPISGWE